MRTRIDTGFSKNLPDNKRLDVSYYDSKFSTHVFMSLWEDGNPHAIASEDKRHFRWELILPIKITRKINMRAINKQSQSVAGIDLV